MICMRGAQNENYEFPSIEIFLEFVHRKDTLVTDLSTEIAYFTMNNIKKRLPSKTGRHILKLIFYMKQIQDWVLDIW